MKKIIDMHPRLKSILRPFYRLAVKLYHHIKNRQSPLPVQTITSDKKIIYFDITSHAVSDVKTGIQRVVAKFLEYLDKTTGDSYDIVCISGLDGYHVIEKDTFCPRNDLKLAPGDGDIYLSIDLNPVQPYEYWDTLQAWQANGCKLIACVYDLVYIKYPEYVASNYAVRLLSRWLKFATDKFDGLLCISATIENELLAWISDSHIHNGKLKTAYFHLGGDFIHASVQVKNPVSVFFEQVYKNKPLTFIAVGTIEPRKGYAELVDAFEELAKENIDAVLLIVGRTGWKYEEIVKKITASECYNRTVFWFSDCEDNLLEILYQAADCYISGSYYEGFGLGITEASGKGLPVLLRDIPVNREVSENKGLYFKDAMDLAAVIKKAVQNTDILREQKRIHVLSWEESVAMAWKSIQRMV